ncbi:UDP-glucuronosyltransferase 2A1 [Branchiostoma belcheri]|nr:UDP-glucuronosyltransferase 2A1 [Branchiostoma belcheri]
MSTEKLTMDSDGYFSRRRGPGPIAFTSLVQLLTASMSVIIIVLAIQQGTHYQKIVADLEKEVAVMKARQEVDLTLLSARLEALEAKTNNAQVTGDMNPRPQNIDVLAWRSEVILRTCPAYLILLSVMVMLSGFGNPVSAEPDKTSDASKSVAESYASTESEDVPAHHQRQKRAANSVTWPAGAGACLQGPPGRDGRDGMPGRDCPCGTKATEIDELQRKCEDLEQRVSDLENTTETTPTPMPCSGDTCNLPSSCTEVAGRSGFDNQAFYVIDPDGPGRGVLPMVVQCDLEGQTAITLIGHDSEARTHVDGFEAPASYSKDVTYWNSMDQVRAVVDQSSLCKQLIKYECHSSVIWGSTVRPHAWWVTWDGRQTDYWGGASPGSGKCACGETGTSPVDAIVMPMISDGAKILGSCPTKMTCRSPSSEYNTPYSVSPEVSARPRVGSPDGRRPEGDPTRGRAGTEGDAEYTEPARDLTAARPNCKSRSAPYHTPHGSRRATDRAPDGSLTETGRKIRRTLGVMTPAGVYAEDMPNGRRFKCDLSIRAKRVRIVLWKPGKRVQ